MSTTRKSKIRFDGDVLLLARLRAGFTQEKLARELDITTRAYQRWEYGLGLPRPENVARAADLLGISTSELYVFEEQAA